jgi:hypothetical protein
MGEGDKVVIARQLKESAAAIRLEEEAKFRSVKSVPIVLRCNTFGSIDAVQKILSQIPQDEVAADISEFYPHYPHLYICTCSFTLGFFSIQSLLESEISQLLTLKDLLDTKRREGY